MHSMSHRSMPQTYGINWLNDGVQCRQLQKAQAGSQVPMERHTQAYYQSTDPQQQGDLLLPCGYCDAVAAHPTQQHLVNSSMQLRELSDSQHGLCHQDAKPHHCLRKSCLRTMYLYSVRLLHMYAFDSFI